MIIIYAVIVFVMAIAKVIKESPGTKAGSSQHTNDDETCGDREDAGSDGQNEEFCFFETENG